MLLKYADDSTAVQYKLQYGKTSQTTPNSLSSNLLTGLNQFVCLVTIVNTRNL